MCQQGVGNFSRVGSVSNWCLLSGILQGFIPCLFMFSVSINNSDEGVKYTVLKFADSAKLEG